MSVVLRLTGQQHDAIRAHLFPGDGKEAVAVLLCGRHHGNERHALSVSEIVPIPYGACTIREPDRVTWPTAAIHDALDRAEQHGLAVVKIHSHPGGFDQFSWVDDTSDRALLPSVYAWVNSDEPHGSAIMLPDGRIFGREVCEDGSFVPFELVSVAGDDLKFWFGHQLDLVSGDTTRRTEQAFGKRTTDLLRRLSVGVVGASGTGGPVIEQLARYSVGRLVIIDPDIVEDKNLNRIPNTMKADADAAIAKVTAHARAIHTMGLGTQVTPLQNDVNDMEARQALASCDVLIGCMDGAEGRFVLNKLASAYNLPYFDVGVKLIADGQGGVSHVIGTVHHLQPDGSSLLSRGVFTMEQVRAEAMARDNPTLYEELKREKYISGVQEDRPAVVSVNTLYASLAVLELLARLHPYRDDPNANFAVHRLSLNEGYVYTGTQGARCPIITRYLGRGDKA